MNAQHTQPVGARKRPKAAIRHLDAGAEPPGAVKPSMARPETTPAQPDSALDSPPSFIGPEQRRAMIAEAAYYRAERRGFETGRELEDWCLAESEIDGKLTRGEIPDADTG